MNDRGRCSGQVPELAAQRPAVMLGAEIRRLRRERGLSQRALVRMIGLSAHSNLSDYEAARRLPPADIITGCERVLQVADGRLHALRRLALADRAAEGSHRSGHIGVAARPRWRDSRRSAPRIGSGQGWLMAGAIVAGGVIFALVSLVVPGGFPGLLPGSHGGTSHATGPSWPATASPGGALSGDGLTPAQAACARGARTVASAALILSKTMSVTTKRRLLAGGPADRVDLRRVPVGRVQLMYSRKCQSEWARVVLIRDLSNPALGSTYVYAKRPIDGTQTAFGFGRLRPVSSAMLRTDHGCILAGGSIRLGNGAQARATTRCI